jgi:hypothetical protein
VPHAGRGRGCARHSGSRDAARTRRSRR